MYKTSFDCCHCNNPNALNALFSLSSESHQECYQVLEYTNKVITKGINDIGTVLYGFAAFALCYNCMEYDMDKISDEARELFLKLYRYTDVNNNLIELTSHNNPIIKKELQDIRDHLYKNYDMDTQPIDQYLDNINSLAYRAVRRRYRQLIGA